MDQPTIYCLTGISASGKTTTARNMVKYADRPTVIVGRDPLREMLFGYSPQTVAEYYNRNDFAQCEKVISSTLETVVKSHLAAGRDVILDNTHLQLKYINEIKKYGYPITFIQVECPLHVAIERDAYRERSVGIDVLRRQHQQYEHLVRAFDFAPYKPEIPVKIEQNEFARKCFIFDIDGTLAINTGRSPFEWSRVGEDELALGVYQALLRLYDSVWIVIVSGRDSVCRPETEAWLAKNKVPYDKLYMRTQGDQRKDAIVKEEFWRDIVQTFKIEGMFDDRLQVIDHARALGFTVFDVAGNTF